VLHIFSAPDKFIAADPYPYLLVSIIVLAFGPGWLALDTLLGKVVRKRAGAGSASAA
jgi:putative oxidoreductase